MKHLMITSLYDNQTNTTVKFSILGLMFIKNHNFFDLKSGFPQVNTRDMGQMVHNYKRVVKGLGCMIIKGLGNVRLGPVYIYRLDIHDRPH